jgi:hypothetical protein
MSSQNGYYEN